MTGGQFDAEWAEVLTEWSGEYLPSMRFPLDEAAEAPAPREEDDGLVVYIDGAPYRIA